MQKLNIKRAAIVLQVIKVDKTLQGKKCDTAWGLKLIYFDNAPQSKPIPNFRS